ncbi:MAG: tetratricopeptide repeat protein [Planctomycetaceae bacterium]
MARVKQELLTEASRQLDLAEKSAETQDERQQILHERVKTLIASGQLEAQTALLAAELNAGTNVSAERWRTLALLQDAANRLNDATASAMKVVELEPQSIPGWTILADLYERSGRLGDGVDAMKKLALLDRRGISEYLKKIARFEIRLGQFDAALKTGREVIKATPGNPEAYQFFADLAFEVGQPQAAVEALRKAVQVNPNDEASLRALAKTLADEFQTPESIELYWRAFEKAPDLESQTNIVVALSNLYLRSNQFEKLIERLELRSRDLNLPAETTRCIATAYREAGDFRKSRETLERLMVDEPLNVSLLKELRTLAEQEHNISQMEQYQRQIVELTASDEERRRLIEILAQQSLYDEAAKERLRLAESRTDRLEILQEIEILVAGGYDDVAETLCQRLLESSKEDWEALNAYRGILLRNHQLAEAREVSRRILHLDVDFDAPASSSTLQSRDSHTETSSTPESQAASAAVDTAESFSKWLIESTENPAASFGAVYCECAASLIFRVGASPSPADIDSVFTSHLSDRDQLRLAAWLIRSVTARSPASPEIWTALEDFLNGSPSPARTAVQLFEACQRYAANDLPAEGQRQLKERSLQLLKTLTKDAPAWLNQTAMPMLSMVPDGQFDHEITTLLEEQLGTTNGIPELTALWSIAARLQEPKRIRDVIAALQIRLAAEPEFAESLEASFSDGQSGFENGDLIAVRLGQDPDALLALLNLVETVGTATVRPAQQSPGKALMTLPEILIDRLGVTAGSNVSWCLQRLVALHAEDRVALWCRTKATTATPREQVILHLIRAELARQLGDDVAEIFSLIDAAVGDPQRDDIKFLIAANAAQQGLIDEAVLVLDSLNLTDGPRQIAREEFVLRQLLPMGGSERCNIAADRLFGLPLNMDQQRDLIPILDKLGMRDKVAAIQARFGRGCMDRQSILGQQLQTYVAQGKHELAGEVGWELLKLASGGSLFSGHRPDDDRDDGGERLQAIKALGRLNRLQPLIDRYEAMLAKSPGSVELLEVLTEFHEAAEQWDLLAAKRDRIALLSKKAPPSLRAKATELERSGDVSGACDVYLTILKDDPEAFSAEMETYVQAFERAKRPADFLTAVLNLKAEYWSDHAGLIINIIADLAREKTNDDVVRKSIETLLANPGSRRLAIGGFLARPDVVTEEKLLPAIESELAHKNALADFGRCNEVFLMLQGLKNKSSLKVLHEFRTRRAEWRQPSGTNADADPRLKLDTIEGAEVILAYLDARLGKRADVEMRVAQLVARKSDMIAKLPGFSPPQVFQLVVFNTLLKELGKDWDSVRLTLLEALSSRENDNEEFADIVLEELGAVYESLGQQKNARNILNQRVQGMLAGTDTASGNPSESIRELLQAGERIQHSGFPIEGARLLLNVTAHDIDEFTSDLDDDKAVAFKSRFNASQRWARQQIAAEKLVNWFEIAVQSAAQDMDDSEQNPGHFDLLLEVTGTTDPRSRDVATLKSGRMDSVILKAIEKQSFDDEKLRTTLKASIRTLLKEDSPPATVLTAALAFALRMDGPYTTAYLDEIEAAITEKLNLLKEPETQNAVSETAEQSPEARSRQHCGWHQTWPQCLLRRCLCDREHIRPLSRSFCNTRPQQQNSATIVWCESPC